MACGERPGGLGALRGPSCRLEPWFRLEGGREGGAPHLPSTPPPIRVFISLGNLFFTCVFYLADTHRRPTKSTMNLKASPGSSRTDYSPGAFWKRSCDSRALDELLQALHFPGELLGGGKALAHLHEQGSDLVAPQETGRPAPESVKDAAFDSGWKEKPQV